jgi:hypothetical protein
MNLNVNVALGVGVRLRRRRCLPESPRRGRGLVVWRGADLNRARLPRRRS